MGSVRPPTGAEREKGALATVYPRGREGGVAVAKATPVHRQEGKLVPAVGAGEIGAGRRLSAWVGRGGTAEGVLIFP